MQHMCRCAPDSFLNKLLLFMYFKMGHVSLACRVVTYKIKIQPVHAWTPPTSPILSVC